MDKPVLRVSRQVRLLLTALAGLPGLLVFTWEMFRHSFLDAFLPIPKGISLLVSWLRYQG